MQWLWTAPADNDRGPRYMEKALAAIHQSLRPGQSLTLFYAAYDGQVGLFVSCPDDLSARLSGPLIANYPQCALTAVAEASENPGTQETWSITGELRPEVFPILRHPQFEDQLNRLFVDPIDSVVRAVRPDGELQARIAWTITPANRSRAQSARETVRLLDRQFFRQHPHWSAVVARWGARPYVRWLVKGLGWLQHDSPIPAHSAVEMSASRLHDREETLHAAGAKVGGHLFDVGVTVTVIAAAAQAVAARDRLHQLTGAISALTSTSLATFCWRRAPRRRRQRAPRFLLAHDELATVFHPPTASLAADGLHTSAFTELAAPGMLPDPHERGAVSLGQVQFRNDLRIVAVTREARRRHVYIVGATGTGKSTLLLNLMRQELVAGDGLTVIDVHGDLAEGLLRLVPPQRTNDIVVFDPAAGSVVPFNPLACPDARRTDQVVSGVVSAFRKLYDSWGPRLENLLRFAVFAVVEQQGTLHDVLLLLTDPAVRERAVPRIADDVVRSFWQHEFAAWNAAYRTEAVSSVTNKILPFLTNRRLRDIVAARGRPGLDLRQIMDRGQVLVINLSRGQLGQDNATLLGSLLLTAIEQAALNRADQEEAARRDHSLYLDEFQTLVTPSTAILLSESRKYRLNLNLSHQLTRQLDEATWQSVVGNCGTLVAFRVGAEDAELLAPGFSRFPGQLSPSSLMGLPNYTCYVRLPLEGGLPSPPFSLRTAPPPVAEHDRGSVVRRASQRRFGGSRESASATQGETVAPRVRYPD